MKNKALFTIILSMMISLTLSSCHDTGHTTTELNGNEQSLPPELKGLKVYTISTGDLRSVKVAVLDNKINSTTYSQGKTQQTTLIINKQDNRVVEVSNVLFESDSLIVCRKQIRN